MNFAIPISNAMPAIHYQATTPVSFDQVMALYTDAGWSAYTRTPETLKRAIAQSLFILTAWDGSQLVGLLRAVGDGQTILYIQDILVLQRYRRQGIGGELLQRCLKKYAAVRQIVLLTDNTGETTTFYESAGFTKTNDLKLQAYVRIKHKSDEGH